MRRQQLPINSYLIIRPKIKCAKELILESLMGMKDYKTAEKVVKQVLKANPSDARNNFQLVKIYKGIDEEKKGNKLIEKIISRVNNNDDEIRATADLFEKEGYLDNAIAVYEKGKSFEKDFPYLYAPELALLYNKKGDIEKATESLLDVYVSRPEKSEEIKATFQRIMNQPEKIPRVFQNKVTKRIEKQPNIEAYPDLMAWIYVQQKDYESAFTQIKSIDLKLNEGGRRMIGFARVCFRELQFKAAILAYNAVADLGKEQPYYQIARSEKLTCMKNQLQRNPLYTQEDVKALGLEYAWFRDDPQYLQKETLREYAELEARYAHNIEKAIELLNNVVKANNVQQAFKGRCKLEMGDYELVRDDIWESTLLYSQVDKEFKQDILGEEARFKNAKLSYYTGDFVCGSRSIRCIEIINF